MPQEFLLSLKTHFQFFTQKSENKSINIISKLWSVLGDKFYEKDRADVRGNSMSVKREMGCNFKQSGQCKSP